MANLLLFGHLSAFYKLEQDVIYSFYGLFEEALSETPGVGAVAIHLASLEVHPHLYLFNWFQTLYLKVLPLEVANHVWDGFLLDGTKHLIRVAVSIVKLFSQVLLRGTFEDCIKLLSCSPGEEEFWNKTITEKSLFEVLERTHLSAKMKKAIDALDRKAEQRH